MSDIYILYSMSKICIYLQNGTNIRPIFYKNTRQINVWYIIAYSFLYKKGVIFCLNFGDYLNMIFKISNIISRIFSNVTLDRFELICSFLLIGSKISSHMIIHCFIFL